jgi:hypothetical protein
MLTNSKARSTGSQLTTSRKPISSMARRSGVKTTIVDEQNGSMTLHLPGDRDTLVYEKRDLKPGNYTILNFPVDNIEGAVDELTKRGVQFERYEGFEQDEKGIAGGGGPPLAWFTDPAGNILSLIQDQ